MFKKRCSHCKKLKDARKFVKCAKNKDGRQYNCKDCYAVYQRERRVSRRAAGHESYEARSHKRMRVTVLLHYGGPEPTCSCCGEHRYEFLALDHINGGGQQHRKDIMLKHGQHLYRWLIHQNFPEGFRVLCHNCNSSHGYFGYCPHDLERQGKNGKDIIVGQRWVQPHAKRDAILEALKEGLSSPSAIASRIGSVSGTVRTLLCMYRRQGFVAREKRGVWTLPFK